jgi:polyhydroxyalkanoate synthesis repressor PhaR
MADKVIFKKYPNRRLYDTEKSAYVSIEQVSETIKGGRDVAVFDAKTGEDVTAFILSQILVEEAKSKKTLLPVSLLHLIVRYGDNLLGEFFEKYLDLAIKSYLASRATFDEQFKQWLTMGSDFSTIFKKTMPGFTPLGSFFDLFSNGGRKPKE